MKNQKQDFFAAFKQLFALLAVIIWIGWLYMFLTGSSSKMMQTNKYGRSWFDKIDSNGMLFLAILVSIFAVSLFFIKPRK